MFVKYIKLLCVRLAKQPIVRKSSYLIYVTNLQSVNSVIPKYMMSTRCTGSGASGL